MRPIISKNSAQKQFEYYLCEARQEDVDAILVIEKDAGLCPWSKEDYAAELTRGDSVFLVVRDTESLIVGFVLARLIIYQSCDQPLLNENEIEILNIAIKARYRQLKLGSKLLDRVISIGRSSLVSRILLEVRETNLTAQKFYLKHGFEYSGRRKNYYSEPPEDALLMRLEVPTS